ncbi:hypothetical protein BJ741DRAFT_715975, partial [Chytriomyces cf. hyalinus JEL632]
MDSWTRRTCLSTLFLPPHSRATGCWVGCIHLSRMKNKNSSSSLTRSEQDAYKMDALRHFGKLNEYNDILAAFIKKSALDEQMRASFNGELVMELTGLDQKRDGKKIGLIKSRVRALIQAQFENCDEDAWKREMAGMAKDDMIKIILHQKTMSSTAQYLFPCLLQSRSREYYLRLLQVDPWYCRHPSLHFSQGFFFHGCGDKRRGCCWYGIRSDCGVDSRCFEPLFVCQCHSRCGQLQMKRKIDLFFIVMLSIKIKLW